MKIKRIDHIGIVVNDLADAIAFFADLGFTVQGEGEVQGELVDKLIGLNDVRSQIVFLQAEGVPINIELSKFHHPINSSGALENSVNTPGIRHISLAVEGIEEAVETLKLKGREFFSEIQNYEDVYKLVYVRGPEGIIVELAEPLKKD